MLADPLTKLRWKLRPIREAVARVVRRPRNLIADPPPRSEELLYDGYELSYPDIAFHFRLRRKSYTHHVILDDMTREAFAMLGEAAWAPLLHHIGLLFAPYHWRVTDIASVRSTCSPDDLGRFHEAMSLGQLAEFRYRWGLDPRRRVLYRSDVDGNSPPARRVALQDKVLVLNGGGKDSIVAAELLRAMGVPFAWFTVSPNAVKARVIATSGVTETYSASFRIDPALGRDAKYSFGGGEPIMGLVSSLAVIPAVLHGFRFITIGNEYSANFAMRLFRGMDINHQHGKSYVYEAALAEVIDQRLVEGLTYFSILRPFYELRLAALFSRFDKYLDAFVSCNIGIARGEWCKACPKCAFVFLVLYPFLDLPQIERVFGENLFHRPRIRALMLNLAGLGPKPWECVGTPEESQLALFLSLEKSPDLVFREWPRREDLERACAGLDVPAATEKYLHGFHLPHRIPPQFEPGLEAAARGLDRRV